MTAMPVVWSSCEEIVRLTKKLYSVLNTKKMINPYSKDGLNTESKGFPFLKFPKSRVRP